MYNRYIPQNDGTYRRSRVQDAPRKEQAAPQHEAPAPEPCSSPEEPVPCRACVHNQHSPRPTAPWPRKNTPPVSIGSFLKQILPGSFDTEDMLIVLLLLLMAGDCREEPNFALLTLALYLFL